MALSSRRAKVRRGARFGRGAAQRIDGYDVGVSQAERVDVEESILDADDRAWLEQRLAEYKELLAYLHDH